MMMMMMMMVSGLFQASVASGASSGATAGLGDGSGAACSASTFPTPLNNTMCFGMKQQTRNKMGAPIKTLTECLDACCEDTSCTVYQ